MALLVYPGPKQAVTLCLTSEPVTFYQGVPLEVPDGYVPTLLNRDLTQCTITVYAPGLAPNVAEPLLDPEAGIPVDGPAPEAPEPRRRGRKAKPDTDTETPEAPADDAGAIVLEE